MSAKKTTILTFIDYYLPGYKGGGPIHSLSKLMNNFRDTLNFKIITRNHDLGDKTSYANIKSDTWLKCKPCSIIYLSSGIKRLIKIGTLIKADTSDILLLNSFFSPTFSCFPFLLSIAFRKKYTIIILPRGELLSGALQTKAFKKKIFINLAKIFYYYQDVIWLASSEIEKDAILKSFQKADVKIASEFPPVFPETIEHQKKKTGRLRILFLGRITCNKNLADAVDYIKKSQGNIIFDIYGPIENPVYFRQVLGACHPLPPNTSINYKGTLKHKDVPLTMVQYDLFLLPTHGENYGYAILEALSVGTPVLLSDQTPWTDINKYKAGFAFPLNTKQSFIDTMNKWVFLEEKEHEVFRQNAKRYAQNIQNDRKIVQQYQDILQSTTL